jgi:tetratricopeptide (TPR) repeat protein
VLALVFFGLPASGVPLEKGSPYASNDDLLDEIDALLTLTALPENAAATAEHLFGRYEVLARWLTQIGDAETSLLLARKASTLFSDEPRADFLHGWVLGVRGDTEQAVEKLRQGLSGEGSLLPDPEGEHRGQAHLTLGGFLLSLEQYEDAAQELEKAKETDPDQAIADYLLGTAYFHLGKDYLAAKGFERGLQQNPDLATPQDYFLYIESIDRMNQPRQADRALRKATLQFPNVPGFYFNWGLNAETRRATPEAYYHYQMERLVGGPKSPYSNQANLRIARIEGTLLENDAKNQPIWDMIRYLKIQEKEIAEGTLENSIQVRRDRLFEKIAGMDPREKPFLYHLQAEGHQRNKNLEKSLAILTEARDRHPRQVIFILQEVDVLTAMEKPGEADDLLNEALLIAPDHWKVREVIGPSHSTLEVGDSSEGIKFQ